MSGRTLWTFSAGRTARRLLWIVAGAALFVVVIRAVSWREAVRALAGLTLPEIFLLVLANGGVLLLLAGRWQLLLAGLGHRVPLGRIVRYHLAGAGVSYFTPGPQFGGEPLQVLLLVRREAVPLPQAAASVAVDKGLTLLANFTFLLVGLWLLLARRLLPETAAGWGLLPLLAVLALPAVLLAAWAAGRRPLTRLVRRLPAGVRSAAVIQVTGEMEAEITRLSRSRPLVLGGAAGLALFGWLLLMGEYWLMASFLGLPLSGEQALILLTAVRLSWLLPIPTGLGTLEAAQIWGLALVGLSVAAPMGVSLGLLIRLRDVLLGLAGLFLVGFRGRPGGGLMFPGSS